MKTSLKMGFLLLCVISTYSSVAYECKDGSIEATTHAANFMDNGDGTVTDLRYGLQWQTCTLGQAYDIDTATCKSDPLTFNTWSEAIMSQDNINARNAQGFDDWRLPNIKELQSIVERQCNQPAINLSIFKGTANGVYWSNTPDNGAGPLSGRLIDFSDGTEIYKATSPQKFVRHVRLITQ